MVDEYWTGSTDRISPEAPVPVVLVQHMETRPGGAANVAENCRALGANVKLLGDFGGIRKLRVMSRHQQLIRLDFEQPLAFDREALLEEYRLAVRDADVVILSDYGKGTLVDVGSMIFRAAVMCRKPVLIDPKGADWAKYRGATLLTPNLKEFELVVGQCPDEPTIVERGRNLLEALSLRALLVTRGEHGMTLVQRGEDAIHLPAQAREVYDVTGAGDTVIATMAVELAEGKSMAYAAMRANLAAGIKVGKLGTATVTRAELDRA